MTDTLKSLVCASADCNRPIPSLRAMFCSPYCRKREWDRVNRAPPLRAPPWSTKSTANQLSWETASWLRVCVSCGESLRGLRHGSVSCSPTCRQRLRRRGPLSRSELLNRVFGLPPKDFWRTPPWFVDELVSRLGPFDLDAAATPQDALAPAWIDPTEDALTVDWSTRGANVIVNPPYSRLGGDGHGLLAWAEAAVRARNGGATVAMIVPPAPSTRYHQLLKAEGELLLHPPHRLAFLDPDTGKPVRGNRGDTMAAVLRPGVRGPARDLYIEGRR